MPRQGSNAGKVRSRFIRRSAKPGAKRKPKVVLLLGSKSIGKTCLVKRHMDGKFVEEHIPTVEDRFPYNLQKDSFDIHCEIIDIDPFDFPAERDLHVKNASVIILVYEVRNRKSFEIMQKIYDGIKDVRDSAVPLLVVATKCDKLDSTAMMGEEKDSYVDEFVLDLNSSKFADGVKHINTSSKLGYNVDEVFTIAFDNLIKVHSGDSLQLSAVDVDEQQGSGCPCVIL